MALGSLGFIYNIINATDPLDLRNHLYSTGLLLLGTLLLICSYKK